MIALILRLYGLLVRALPVRVREAWGTAMLRDLERMMEVEVARRGRLAGVWLGTGALWDLGGAVLRERWVASRGYEWERRARASARMGMGERTMMWIRELRLAARALLRRPGFTAIATLTLGLGIGATVAIFTFVNAVVIQPLPYPDSDRLVEIRHSAPAIDLPELTNSPGTIAFYRERARIFDGIVGVQGLNTTLTSGDRAEPLSVALVEPSFFEVFRTSPRMGRAFGEDDVVPDGDPARVAVLTHAGWMQLFGGEPGVVGRSIRIEDFPMEVIGVMPEDFRVPGNTDADALFPLWINPAGGWGTFGTTAYARLAEGISHEQATRELQALQTRIPEYDPEITLERLEGFGWSASLPTLKERIVGDTGSTLLILLGTVGFVLLIACANVANLFLVRAESRQKELAIRAAMGAGRARVAGGFLSESIVLGALGGLLGMAIAWTGVEYMLTLDLDLPRAHEIALTPTVLGFAGLVSVASALLLGMIPMVRYAGRGFAAVLRDGNRTSTASATRHRARNVLVMSQLALGLVLLVGSGLMYRSLQALQRIDLGFEPDDVLVMSMNVGQSRSARESATFYQEVTDRISALPEVEVAGYGNSVPLLGGNFSGGSFQVEGEDRGEEAIPEIALYRGVGPGWMEALGMQLVEGRAMTRSDWEAGPPVVWVNEYFRDTFLDGEAIGKRVNWSNSGAIPDSLQFVEIVGVYRQIRESSPTEDPGAFAVLPMLMADWGYPQIGAGHIVVRGRDGMDVTALAPRLREIVAELNPGVPITETQSLQAIVDASMSDRAVTMVLLGIATTVALFLAMIGLFGVISYVIGQRTREIGVRMALGADRGEVSGMVIRQGAGVIVGGIVLGLVGAAALTRVLSSLLYDVSAMDPITFVGAPLLLLGVSLLATWLPARKAARVDPIEALRGE